MQRTLFAFPVFGKKYETDRQRLKRGTGIEVLYRVGRNGEFMHLFKEDVYVRSVRTAGRVAEERCRLRP